jgi:protein SCO1/2
MKTQLRNLSLTLLGLVLLSVPALGQNQSVPSQVFTDVGIDQHLNEQVPLDLKFTDETGKSVTLGDYIHDKPVVLSLVYYRCPMLCTQVLNGMVETFNIMKFTIGKEFDVVTVSIDPAETPDLAAQKKATYVAAYRREGARTDWHFLTGEQAAITKLASAAGFRYVYDPKTRQFAHASGIMVVTPAGKLARYLYGIEYAAKDMNFSLIEASKEKIGSPVQQLQLLCYAYDPSTGTYSLVVGNILRGAGALTILLLGGYMAFNFRKDKKKAMQAAQHEPTHSTTA